MERGSAEVRLNEDRTVDEIVMHTPLLFHLEQMDDGRWWMRLTRSEGQDMDINLYTKRGAAIACNVESHDGKICEGFGAFSNVPGKLRGDGGFCDRDEP